MERARDSFYDSVRDYILNVDSGGGLHILLDPSDKMLSVKRGITRIARSLGRKTKYLPDPDQVDRSFFVEITDVIISVSESVQGYLTDQLEGEDPSSPLSKGSERFSSEAFKNKQFDLKVGDIKEMGPTLVERLHSFGRNLETEGFEGGLLFWLATSSKSLREIERELKVPRKLLGRVFDYYQIPRLSQSEASRKVIETFRQDPVISEKIARSSRERFLRAHQDSEFEAKRIEGIRKAVQQPGYKQRKSEASKKMWKDHPELKEKVLSKLREGLKNAWKDPEKRRRFVEGLKRRANDPGEKRKQSERSKKIWQDPKLTEKIRESVKRRMNNPEVRQKLSESAKRRWKTSEKGIKAKQAREEWHPHTLVTQSERMKQRWQDSEYREKMIKAHKNPEFRAKISRRLKEEAAKPDSKFRKALDRNKRNPYRLQRTSEETKKRWTDPSYREKMKKINNDPEFKKRRIEGAKQKWRDSDFKARKVEEARRQLTERDQNSNLLEKAAEGIRHVRSNPENTSRFFLKTLRGFREDLGFYTQSAWEANIARVLLCCNRDFKTRQSFRLLVDEEHKDLFKFDITQFTVDFVVIDPRGNNVIYEIMGFPRRTHPERWAKLDLFKDQYPDIRVHVITQKLYMRLHKHFADVIERNLHLFGWETTKRNIYTEGLS